MTTLQKKICMLGAVGVGKTSLVRRFVESIFSERYQATVGVKIDRKTLLLGEHTLNLMLWDLQGEAGAQTTRLEYLRGAAGHLLVADATRRETLATVASLAERVMQVTPGAPFILVLNKTDLAAGRQVSEADLGEFRDRRWTLRETSALTGAGVDEAFTTLAHQLLESPVTGAEDR